jgi:hypothetical protein
MANSLLFSMLVKMDADQAKAELAAFTAAMGKAGHEGAALAGKLPAATKSTHDLGRAHQSAAGSVGNLVANLNDVGMMIAAGQNPLQLAIQQGTQISQVIGPMGAAGAVKALGGAFLSFLSPINFVTLAVIAGGAALAQWAMSGEESKSAAERLTDEIENLGDAMEALKNADKVASADIVTVVAQYGRYASQAREVLDIQRQIAEVKATRAFDTAVNSAADVFDGGLSGFSVDELKAYATQLLELRAQQAALAEEEAAFGRIATQAQADAYEALMARVDANSLALAQTSSYRSAVADLATEFGITEQAAADLAVAAAKVREADNTADRVDAAKALAQYIYDSSDGMRHASDEAVGLYEALNTALLAGLDLQAIDIATGIGAGADEAARLGGNLAEAANAWLVARSLAQQPGRLALDKYGARGTPSNRPIEDGNGEVIRITSSTRAAGAAKAQTDSVAKLIEKLQAELDISRELDPVQREMAQYRDQMAKATEAEAEQIEVLIATREREKAAMETLSYVGAQTGNALVDALMGGADAGERLIDTLMRAALQAALLGQGPLASLLGGGALFDGLFGGGGGTGAMGLPTPFATGGMIYGAGGPRDDAVPIMASPGEFMVNARATQRHRVLLEQINSGQLDRAPAFADGGMLGGGAASGAGGGGMAGGAGIVFNAHFDLRGAQGDDAVRAAAKEGMDAALREFARADLPRHIRRISSDPSVVRF